MERDPRAMGEVYKDPALQENEGYVSPVGFGTPEKGRKEIPIERAIKIQKKLTKHMAPDEIRALLSDPDDLDPLDKDVDSDPVFQALGMRWMEKYMLGFNGFTEYCNDPHTERGFIERAIQGTLTSEDYDAMKQYFIDHEHGGPFLEAKSEIDEFLRPFVH